MVKSSAPSSVPSPVAASAAVGKSSSPTRRGRGSGDGGNTVNTDTTNITGIVGKATTTDSSSMQISLANRKKEIQNRLAELDVRTTATISTSTSTNLPLDSNNSNNSNSNLLSLLSHLPTNAIPLPAQPTKSIVDTHWDYTLKEMAWLSADYQSERKRQLSQAKKISNAILQYHSTLTSKKARDRSMFQGKVKRLAGKLGRMVQHHYWKKIERVVEYKQQLVLENSRREDMDKQLVFLVRQTERYGERLLGNADSGTIGGVVAVTDDDDGEEGDPRKQSMTIEDALSSNNLASHHRTTKSKSIDYSRMDQDDAYRESSFYGERIDHPNVVGANLSEEVGGENGEGQGEEEEEEASSRGRSARRGNTTTATTTNTSTTTAATTIPMDESYEPPSPEEMAHEAQVEDEEYALLLQSFHEECTYEDVQLEIAQLKQEQEMDVMDVISRLMEEQEEDVKGVEVGGVDAEGAASKEKEPHHPLIEVIGATFTDEGRSNAEKINEDGGGDGGAADRSAKRRRVCFAPLPATETSEPRMPTSSSLANIGEDNRESEDLDDTSMEDEEVQSEHHHTTMESDGMSKGATLLALLDEDDHEEKDEFHVEMEELDDETTIEAEERMGRDMSYQEEIDMLKRESEMSIEELRAMYANMDDRAEEEEEEDESSENNSVAEDDDTAKVSALSLLGEDDYEDKDEFHIETDELDDETTIEVEERLGREMSYQEEIDMLKREGEMSIEELKAMYANMDDGEDDDLSENDSIAANDDSLKVPAMALLDEDDHEEKDEFHVEAEELDDETTIEAEERMGRDMSYQDEIDLLKRESEMSIEELRAMYANREDGEEEEEGDDSSENDSIAADDDTSKVEAMSLLDEDDYEEKDEFHVEAEELDDETTIEVEERLGRDMSYQEEIELLKRESEMSIEELRAMYATAGDEEDEDVFNENDSSTEEAEIKDDDRTEVDDGMEISPNECPADSDSESAPSQDKSMTDNDEAGAIFSTPDKETMLTRPFLLASWVKLRAYQHVGLNWLVSIQTRRLNGILADEMGLGKTLQTISMLAYLASYKGIWGPHLIIVPTSCLVNWEVEFKRFCPGLKVMCYYGNAKRRKELRTGWTKTNVLHVVITSYQLAVQDAFAFKRKKWYYLILDEAHMVKNFESQRWQTLIGFNTQRRLLLTGTPLQNNLMELWSLLHFLMPHIFSDRKQFSYWFANPMDSIIEGNSKRNDDLMNRLHGIIRPFVLRRLKKDVETQLPGKYEHIVKCQLSRRQMFLYEEFMARSSTRKAMSGGNFMGMMNVLMQLRKVCNHPDLFEPRSVTTPFVMEQLKMVAAPCVVNALEPQSALEELSPSLRLPLWTLGEGTPSFEKSTSRDPILAAQLSQLMAPASSILENVSDDNLTELLPPPNVDSSLCSFLSRIRDAERLDRISRAKSVSVINKIRCGDMPFPFSGRLCKAVAVDLGLCNLPVPDELTVSQIASTPTELLAMRKTQDERAMDLNEVADKFIFCVPKAGTQKPILFSSSTNSSCCTAERILGAEILPALENYFSPFVKAESRLTVCFPDKKLIQFDAGKLQTLATLLRELKQGGHRVLIFTQMSRMLDILQSFLNLHGHIYLRLDGATDVDKRQRLMDRFNNDTKIFCFILSTRSGGLGINLTGADTVVFVDSDWNPAMDAQAQDRAHRIGQTKEVHIYRLITEHSIEENILTKAKQKRNLDFLVMDEGKFHSTAPVGNMVDDEVDTEDSTTFTKDKLQSILLGVDLEVDEPSMPGVDDPMSQDQVESAMAALEDEDDVKAMQSAKQEAAEALQEFDETIEEKQGEKASDETKAKKTDIKEMSHVSAETIAPDQKQTESSDDDKEMEKEFKKWQRRVGMDANTIHDSLNPLERYGLLVKEHIDPHYSKYFWMEQQRIAQTSSVNNEWNIEEIERRKVRDEQQAFEDGDLLATFPDPESLPRQRKLYIREKSRLRSDVMKRQLTGQNWAVTYDERSGKMFWYNTDTGESVIEKPQILKMLEAEDFARKNGWAALPHKSLVKIMEFLVPYPERRQCSETCSAWRVAANDESFVLHVWPVELGALVMDENKLGRNHFRTISDACLHALPGDSIELGDGHYFINDGLLIDKPIKFVGDEDEPGHVILELSGTMVWKSYGGWMEGITIRRSTLAKSVSRKNEILRIDSGGRLDVFYCVFDNRGCIGNCSSIGNDATARWEKAVISGGSEDSCGLRIGKNAKVQLIDCQICDNDGKGLVCDESAVVTLNDCVLERNRLTPTQDRKKTLAIAEANKRKRLEEEYTSSFPLIAGTQRQ